MKFQYRLIKGNQGLETIKFLASVLFWKEDRSKWFQYFIEAFSNLQLIAIIFYGSTLYPLRDSEEFLPKIIRDIAQALVVDNFRGYSSFSSNNILMMIISGYFFVVLCLFGLARCCYLKRQKVFNSIHVCLTYCAQLHHTIIFWGLSVYLMSFWTTNGLKTSPLFNLDTSNILLFFATSLLIMLNYLFGFITALFCYDPFLTKNPLAGFNPDFQTLTFFSKALICPILIYISDLATLKWVFAIITAILVLLRQELLLLEMPYYKCSSLKMASILSSCALSPAITNLIGAVISEYDWVTSLDIIYLTIVITLLLIKLNLTRIQYKIYHYISIPIERLNNQRDVFKKIFAINNIYSGTKFFLNSDSDEVCNLSLLYLMGDMVSHSSNCKEVECICQYTLKYKNNKNKFVSLFEIHKTSSHSKTNILVEALTKVVAIFQGDNIFRLLLAYAYLKDQKKFSSALFTLYSTNRRKTTFREDILIMNISQQLEEDVIGFFENPENINKKTQTLNMRQIIDFEKNSSQIFSLVSQNTMTFLQLWESFIKPNSNLTEFFSLSIKAENEAEAIQTFFNKTFHKQRHLSLCVCLYGCYLATIRNVPCKAEKLVKQYNENLGHKLHRVFGGISGRIKLDGSGDVIFYISMARERIGKVLHVSRSIFGELGWSQADLIGQNIKTIQPSAVKEKHDQILINHIEGVKNHRTHHNFESFVRKKEGYSIPVYGHVTIFPFILNEPVYAGIIRRKQINEDFLVISSDGTVDTYSQQISRDLEFPTHKQINISQICQSFSRSYQDLISDLQMLRNQAEIILTFQSFSSIGSKGNKEIIYVTKVSNQNIADQQFICLYLTKKLLLDENERISMDVHQDFFEEFISNAYQKPEMQSRGDMYKKSQDSLLLPIVSNFDQKRRQKRSLSQLQYKSLSNFGKMETIQLSSNRKNSFEVTNTVSNLLVPRSNLSHRDSANEVKSDHEIVEIGSNTKSKSGASREKNSINEKLEQAIYTVPKQTNIKILNYLISFFTILCAGLMCFHLIDSYSEFNSMLKKIDLITASHRRTLTMVSLSGNIQLLGLINKGILSDNRHTGAGIASWKVILQSSITEQARLLHIYNFQVLQALYTLDQSAQETIFNDRVKINKKDLNLEGHLSNQVELFTELVTATNTITHLASDNISMNHPDVKFVIDNSFNDVLLVSERMMVSLIKSSKQHLFSIRDKILVILALTVVSGVIILLLLLLDVKYFFNKRNQFIEILLKLDRTMLKRHMEIANRLNQSIQHNLFNFQLYSDIKQNLSDCVKSIEAKERHQQKVFKSKKKLNIHMARGLLLTIMLIMGFSSSFIVFFEKFDVSLGNFLQNIDKVMRTCRLHTNLKLLDSAVIQYIIYNNSTTIRNKPVEKAINEILNLTNTIPEHFTQVLSNNTGPKNDLLLQSYILGELCQFTSIPEFPEPFCSTLVGNTGARGLITMSSYLIHSYKESKTLYDQSNKTVEAAIDALSTNGKILGEELILFVSKAILSLEDILREDLKQSVVKYREEVIVIIVIYACIYIGLGLILSLKVWKMMKMERDSWRKMVRQIPFSIISSNKLLKNYIIHNCDHFLDSFKNVI